MEITVKNYVPMFQEGGPMPEEAPAEAPVAGGAPEELGGDPIMLIVLMAMQALLGQDCEAAFAVCEGFIQLVQDMQGGGGAAPEAAPQGEPVYRTGGKLVGRMNY